MKNEKEILGGAATKGSHCLSLDELETLAAGLGSEQARQHCLACLHCGTELEMLATFSGLPATADEAAEVEKIARQLRTKPSWRGAARPERRGWLSRLFAHPAGGIAVAGLAAMLAVGIWWQRPSPAVPANDLTRSLQVEGIAPTGDLPMAPATVRWTQVPGAARYQVRLIEVDQNVIWQMDSGLSELRLPAEVRAAMVDRKTLFWAVTALDAQGKAIAASAPRAFRVVQGKP